VKRPKSARSVSRRSFAASTQDNIYPSEIEPTPVKVQNKRGISFLSREEDETYRVKPKERKPKDDDEASAVSPSSIEAIQERKRAQIAALRRVDANWIAHVFDIGKTATWEGPSGWERWNMNGNRLPSGVAMTRTTFDRIAKRLQENNLATRKGRRTGPLEITGSKGAIVQALCEEFNCQIGRASCRERV